MLRCPVWIGTGTARAKAIRGVVQAVALVGLALVSGCSSDPEPVSDDEKTETTPDVQPVVARSRIAGTPAKAGYLEGLTMLQTGPDPLQKKGILASEANKFLLAILVEVGADEQTLIPTDYRVQVGTEVYQPIGVSFGNKLGLFFDTDQFAAASIEISHGSSDGVGLQSERLAAAQLATPQLALLYKVTGSDAIRIQHGESMFNLEVDDQPDWIATPSSASLVSGPDTVKQPVESAVELEVVKGQLVIGELDRERAEVYELQLKIECPDEGLMLNARDLYLQGAGNRTRQFYFDFDDKEMRMAPGSVYVETTYNGERMRRVEAGGLRLGLYGGTLSLRLVFEDPPFETGLVLHFPQHAPVELIASDQALGEIRPAFAEDTVRVPRAPIIGEPVQVGYLDGLLPFVADWRRKRMDNAPLAAGRRLLMLKMMVGEEDQRFIAGDYQVASAAGEKIRLVYVAPGRAPAEPVPTDKFAVLAVAHGDTDAQRQKRAKLAGWQISIPEFVLVFDVPANETKFTFKHGTTQLTLQPSSVARPWGSFRPRDALLTLAGKSSQNRQASGKLSAADSERRAASALRMAKLYKGRNSTKSREYAQRVLKLVPDSDLSRQAQQLIDTLKP